MLQPETPNAEEVETEAEAIEPSSPSNVLYHCKYCNGIFAKRGCATHFSSKHRRDWIGDITQFFEECYDCQDNKCTKKANSIVSFTNERSPELLSFDTTSMKAARLNDSQLSMADPHQNASQVTPYVFQRNGARADLGDIDLM